MSSLVFDVEVDWGGRGSLHLRLGGGGAVGDVLVEALGVDPEHLSQSSDKVLAAVLPPAAVLTDQSVSLKYTEHQLLE